MCSESQESQRKEWLILPGNIEKGIFDDLPFKLSLETLWLRSEERAFRVKGKSKCY